MQLPLREQSPGPRGASIDKAQKMGWTTLDKPGVPFLADKRDLHIDSTYQRTMVVESRVLQIAHAWSWVACGSLVVAERDKVLWVIDGQHRASAAMRRSDITELPCLVFKSESVEEEALAFFRANCGRGNVTPFDKLRALLAARDQLAIDAVTLMEAAGYRPAAAESENSVRCVAMFLGYMRSDRGTLQKLWPLIAELHGGLCIKARVLSAFMYLGKFGTDDISSQVWRDRVVKQGLGKISDSIDRVCSLYQRGGSKLYAIGALEVINRGVRGAHRLQINESGAPDDDAGE